MRKSEEPTKLEKPKERLRGLTLDMLAQIKASKEGIPVEEVKLTLAIPHPDGRQELTLAEIKQIQSETSRFFRPIWERFLANRK